MIIRKFLGANTQEVMLKVKNELGPEALIISTKRVRQKGIAGFFKKKLTEVTAAIDDVEVKKIRALAAKKQSSNLSAASQNVFQQFQNHLQAQAQTSSQTPAAPLPQMQAPLPQAPLPQMQAPSQARTNAPQYAQAQAHSHDQIHIPSYAQALPPAAAQAPLLQAPAQTHAPLYAQPHTAARQAQPQMPQQISPQTQQPAAYFTQPPYSQAQAQAQAQTQGPARARSERDRHAGDVNIQNTLAANNAFVRSASQRQTQSADADADKITELERKLNRLEDIVSRLDGVDDALSKMVYEDDAAENMVPLTKVLQLFYSNLVKNEVEPEISRNIVDKVGEQLCDEENSTDAATVLYNEVFSALGKPETITLRSDKKPTVVIFIGPTGVGKTTTLAKIAAGHSLEKNLKVGLITADTYRIAAVEQLKTYAEILGLPISVIYTPKEMKSAIEAYQDKDLVLIDTAGRSYRNKTQFEELKELVTESQADEVFLVLSSTSSIQNNKEIIDNYRFLDEFKLIFTKTDESPTLGMLLNARMMTGKALSYVTIGQSVPDDIEVASADKIARNLIGSLAESTYSLSMA